MEHERGEGLNESNKAYFNAHNLRIKNIPLHASFDQINWNWVMRESCCYCCVKGMGENKVWVFCFLTLGNEKWMGWSIFMAFGMGCGSY
jgi:hypothetical protein